MVPDIEKMRGQTKTDVEAVLRLAHAWKSKYAAVREFVLRNIEDGPPLSKESIPPQIVEEIGAGKVTLDRVIADLREEGIIRWLTRERDPKTGKFVLGSRWYFVRVSDAR